MTKEIEKSNECNFDKKAIATACIRHIPSWSHLCLDQVKVTPIHGGCSRVLFKAESRLENSVEVVLFRLLNTDSHMSDYQAEADYMTLLAEYGITEGIYFMNKTYRIEKFIKGNHPSKSDPLFSDEVLSVLAKMHGLSSKKELHMISRLRRWLPRVYELDPALQELDLANEIDWLEKQFSVRNMLYGLVHCDLHRLNMLVECGGSVMLHDFEYTGVNPVAYDFANSFFEESMDNSYESPPYFRQIKDNYPSAEKQIEICRRYFAKREMPDADVKEFLLHVKVCTLLSHLMWSLWSVLAFNEVGDSICWGYEAYGKFRMKLYFELKTAMLHQCSSVNVSI